MTASAADFNAASTGDEPTRGLAERASDLIEFVTYSEVREQYPTDWS